MEERRKLGLVRFSLAMDDMRRLVDQVGFAEHEDSDVDEEADSARQRMAAGRRAGAKVCNCYACETKECVLSPTLQKV